MAEIAEVWNGALPEIRDSVTGTGVWSALNAAKAVAFEDGVLVLGLPTKEGDLAGHLTLPAALRAIETVMGRELHTDVSVRVIRGDTLDDWTATKEGDAMKRRLQEQALEKARAELAARSSWEGLYEALSRKFAELPNRSLPQTRARFFLDAIDIVADALREQPVDDERAERNFARVIERVSQYSEVPSTVVAVRVLEKAFER